MATWRNFVRRGRDTVLRDIESHTFEDIVTEEDKQIKDLVFNPELTNQAFTNETKNTATYANETKSSTTFTNETKN